MDDLVADGNSVVLVDHDTQVLGHADWIVEMGPGAGADGGRVIAQGTVQDLAGDARSVIGPFLARQVGFRDGERAAAGGADVAAERVRPVVPEDMVFDLGTIAMRTRAIHTVHPLDVRIPKGRLTVVTGVSGSGKTTMVLESLVPALQAIADAADPDDVMLPAHVQSLSAPGIKHAKLIDATPIGINVRSTVATYSRARMMRNVWDSRQGTSHTIPEGCGVPHVTALARFRSMYSSCPMCRWIAPIAMGRATTSRPMRYDARSAAQPRTAQLNTACRNSCA